MARPVRLFISYAREDEAYRKELDKRLKQLQRDGLVETWHDRKLLGGDEWKQQIDQQLQQADVILLLISADFLHSDYCYDIEMKRAVERHDQGKARVIPIILRPSDWHTSPLGKLQALPKDGRPVATWQDQDEAWLDAVIGIRQISEQHMRAPKAFSAKDSPLKQSQLLLIRSDHNSNILEQRTTKFDDAELSDLRIAFSAWMNKHKFVHYSPLTESLGDRYRPDVLARRPRLIIPKLISIIFAMYGVFMCFGSCENLINFRGDPHRLWTTFLLCLSGVISLCIYLLIDWSSTTVVYAIDFIGSHKLADAESKVLSMFEYLHREESLSIRDMKRDIANYKGVLVGSVDYDRSTLKFAKDCGISCYKWVNGDFVTVKFK